MIKTKQNFDMLAIKYLRKIIKFTKAGKCSINCGCFLKDKYYCYLSNDYVSNKDRTEFCKNIFFKKLKLKNIEAINELKDLIVFNGVYGRCANNCFKSELHDGPKCHLFNIDREFDNESKRYKRTSLCYKLFKKSYI